jgi:homocysteine S-methyltransferase
VSFVVPDDTVLVADGGLATELEALGSDLSDWLWSARLLMDAPDRVRDAHLAFFRAGAVIATSASYQASFEGFARRGLDRRAAAGLMRRSVELARAARDEVAGDGRARWVAASVGPYGAALADGSEYRGRYGLSVRELTAWHRPRLEALAEASPDVLALETVPDVDEAEALMAAIAGLGIPAWLSYSVDGERTRAGQPLADAFAVAAGRPEVVAVGVNCCAPADVPAAIAAARAAAGRPVIVYPNSGEGWDARRRAWTGQSSYSAGLARQWIAAGARIAGGCCRVRPADIAVIAQAAADAGAGLRRQAQGAPALTLAVPGGGADRAPVMRECACARGIRASGQPAVARS